MRTVRAPSTSWRECAPYRGRANPVAPSGAARGTPLGSLELYLPERFDMKALNDVNVATAPAALELRPIVAERGVPWTVLDHHGLIADVALEDYQFDDQVAGGRTRLSCLRHCRERLRPRTR